jgi:hypothetical protein
MTRDNNPTSGTAMAVKLDRIRYHFPCNTYYVNRLSKVSYPASSTKTNRKDWAWPWVASNDPDFEQERAE